MLSPDGSGEKNPAPSIWSFDSGYASQTFEDEGSRGAFYLQGSTSSNSLEGRLDETVALGLGGFSQIHIGEHAQLKIEDLAIEPTATNISVYTAKDAALDNAYLPKIYNDDATCLTCDFYNFTTPGENIRCDDCRLPEIIKPLLPPPSERSRGKKSRNSSQTRNKSGRIAPHDLAATTKTRCSACELSAMINPSAPTSCSSCDPHRPGPPSAFPQVSGLDFGYKIRRSRAGRASKLPLSALNTLQAWLDAHADNPYPSAEIKKQLAQECGITEKQVTTWFTNARARQLSPLDTWLSSGSEDECAKETDIERAADGLAYTGGFTYLPDASNPEYRRAGSVVSASSLFSNNQTRMQPSRRGKKKDYRRNKNNQTLQIPELTTPAPTNVTPANNGEQDLWQCTFCRQHLVPKSWRRHEETQHHTRAQWTCMLFGPRLSANAHTSRPSTSSSFCAFCMQKNPSEDHFLKHHRISECAKRPVADRTFFRPDHLRQHVKNFHGSTLHDVAQVRWKREGDDKGKENNGWICGFCGDGLDTWNKRETHIANHFKDGMTMDQWTDYAAPSTKKSTKKQSKKEEKEEKGKKEEKEKDHIHGLGRLSRSFTRRSTRNSLKSTASQQPAQTTFASAFESLPATTPMPMGYGYSTAPVLPDINMDPLMGNGYTDFVDWSQIGQMQVTEPQYTSNLVFDPSTQNDFDAALTNALGFGANLDYHGPWNQHS